MKQVLLFIRIVDEENCIYHLVMCYGHRNINNNTIYSESKQSEQFDCRLAF